MIGVLEHLADDYPSRLFFSPDCIAGPIPIRVLGRFPRLRDVGERPSDGQSAGNDGNSAGLGSPSPARPAGSAVMLLSNSFIRASGCDVWLVGIVPPVKRHLPLSVAHQMAFTVEVIGK